MGEMPAIAFEDAPFEIIDGDRGKNYPKQHEFSNKGYCIFLNAKNVTNGGFDLTEGLFITKEKDETLRKGKLQPEDVVLTTRGTVGNVAFYSAQIPYENIRINSGMVILRPDQSKLMPSFLYYFLKSSFFYEQVNSFRSGVAQPQLPICDMKRMKILIPSILIQTKIAAILSAYDDLIENNLRRIKILEEMVQFIYREWFVRFRFPGHENIKMVESPLGKIPEGWVVTPISKITKEINERNKENRNLQTLSVTNSSSFVLSDDYFSKRVYSRKQDKYKIIKEGQFAYNPSRINIGSIAFLEDFDVGIVSPMYCVFEATPERVKAPFLWELLKMDNTFEQIKKLCFGTVRQTFKYPDFSLVRTVLPTIGVQTKFINFIQPFHDMRKCLQQKNTLLRQTRDLLLPKLIYGELDISELDIKIPEEVSP